jgi:hypothetical protein
MQHEWDEAKEAALDGWRDHSELSVVVRVHLLLREVILLRFEQEKRYDQIRKGVLLTHVDELTKIGQQAYAIDCKGCADILQWQIEKQGVKPLLAEYETQMELVYGAHIFFRMILAKEAVDTSMLPVVQDMIQRAVEGEVWGLLVQSLWSMFPDRKVALPLRDPFDTERFRASRQAVRAVGTRENEILCRLYNLVRSLRTLKGK